MPNLNIVTGDAQFFSGDRYLSLGVHLDPRAAAADDDPLAGTDPQCLVAAGKCPSAQRGEDAQNAVDDPAAGVALRVTGFDRAALRLRGEKVLLHARDDAAAGQLDLVAVRERLQRAAAGVHGGGVGRQPFVIYHLNILELRSVCLES